MVAAGLLDVYRSLEVATTANGGKPAAPAGADAGGDGEELCPVDCVEELSTIKDFRERVLLADATALVVLDLYKPSCGACRYIANGFAKLCKREGASELEGRVGGEGREAAAEAAEEAAEEFIRKNVRFYKHNVVEDYDEEKTDLARFLKVRNVPLFQFYKDGEKVEQFATRDKERIASAILKYKTKLSVRGRGRRR